MSSARILVVDDSPTQLMMYKMALGKEGYQIVTANNGVEAINIVYEENFDLIVSDILMPEINGYVFCRLVKNDPMKSHIPIILLTSTGQQHDRFWGLEAGASAFIVKDTDTSRLIGEVKKLLRTKVSGSKPFQAFSLHDIRDETNSDIRTKIFQILDRLLFHSSVSNKIREIIRFAYDVTQLKANLFRLLSNLMEYSVAMISFKMKNNHQCTFEINDSVSQDDLKGLMKTTLKGEDLETYQLNIRGKDKISPDSQGQFKSELIVPLIENEVWMGLIGVFSYKEKAFVEEDFKILNIFANELVLIIQFIMKMAEMEDFRTEVTNTLLNDLKRPLRESVTMIDSICNKDISADHVNEALSEIKVNIEKTDQMSEELLRVLEKIKPQDIS